MRSAPRDEAVLTHGRRGVGIRRYGVLYSYDRLVRSLRGYEGQMG
jgi:hypothetical protein